jgi:hypothetical protein
MSGQIPAAEARIDWWELVFKGGKIGGAVGAVAGFVGDFVRPLAACNRYLLLGSIVLAVALAVWWWRLPKAERGQCEKTFPQQACVFALFLLISVAAWAGLEAVAGGDEDRGVVANNLQFLAGIQDSLLGIRREVQGIREDVKDVIKKLDELGTDGELARDPQTPLEWLRNADVLRRRGDWAGARKAFDGYFQADREDFIDAWQEYWDLLKAEYGGGQQGRELYDVRVASRPGTVAGQVVRLAATTGDAAVEELRALRRKHPDFLPILPAIAAGLDPGWTVDFAEYLDLAENYRRLGGTARGRDYLIRPGAEANAWAATLQRFGAEPMPPLSTRLNVEVSRSCGPCDMTIVAVGIGDATPPKMIGLRFPGAEPIDLQLGDSTGTALRHIVLELNPDEAGPPRFTARDSADRRACPHVGTLSGVGAKPAPMTVAFVDGKGRSFTFPQPTTLAISSFDVTMVTPGGFDKRGPLLQITSLDFLATCEVSLKKEGPYIPVPIHEAIPTIREIPVSRIEGLDPRRGGSLWIRGKADLDGRQIGPEQVTVRN